MPNDTNNWIKIHENVTSQNICGSDMKLEMLSKIHSTACLVVDEYLSER